MVYLKEHLTENYNWLMQPDISLYTGIPTRRLFDRNNGAQVLFIINAFAALQKSFSINKVNNVELLIINNLPLKPQSEVSVLKWLKAQALNISG